ncbi:sugar ABC transporter substrate-binding protein [Deinococcus metallilatus]|uniref:Chitobiose transport system substrate-binding protein n=2 Tax=Deinococcus TaxID=1298 RepID=A0AAJ5K0A8_9DEIO|nr:sugar ABC transporter substrate-binding protein [Deinococcus metallilatus]MBB5294015.1 putative chitobiose transport system substrate-binding protein [Deinococcus metallilatus]QBY08807.1 sugar ABC transporter substrate-binding protein [Deinococcus metallilatus]RXJ09951.1 sugar ABC transporter substrate-binding protein [Deinococcus metallilatus]TLK28112.1 sugar ABC transporter substrate-binding protein [Deinococcus metallilatus]GMA16652.1 sugar ABC transporter substrate-binding protein [Dein
MKKFLMTAALLALGSASAQKTQVEFWTIALAPLFNDEMNRLVAQFEKENPNVELKWVDVPASAIEQKLLAAIASGRPPAAVNLASDMVVKMVDQGALEPLTLTDAQKKVYFASPLNTFTFGDKVMGVPWYWAPKVVAYNTDIFRKAGLDPNNPPRTIQTLIAAARQIKDKTGLYGFMPNINNLNMLVLFQEAGLPIFDKTGGKAVFNSPEHVKLLQSYVDLYKQGYIPEDTMRRGFTAATELYSAGKLGMLITGPQFILRVANDNKDIYNVTKVAPYPINIAGNVIHTPLMGFVVPKGVKDKALAQKLALFLTNDVNQLQFSKVTKTTFPSTVKASTDKFFKQGGNNAIDQGKLVSSTELKKAKDLTLVYPDASKLNKVFKDNIEAAMAGQKSAKQALDDIVKAWNASL